MIDGINQERPHFPAIEDKREAQNRQAIEVGQCLGHKVRVCDRNHVLAGAPTSAVEVPLPRNHDSGGQPLGEAQAWHARVEQFEDLALDL
jgi:hypothetical protein